jgi:hypothetical protein
MITSKLRLITAICVILVLSAPARASETSVVASRPFVEVAGGSDFYIEGVGENPTASFKLGLGYRWPRLAVGASFGWTHNLDWDAMQLCLEVVGIDCGPMYRPRDLFGGIAYAKYFPVIALRWLQPYMHGGFGFFLLDGQSSDDDVSFAYSVRGGLGVEFGISEFVSLNLEFSVVHTSFPAPDEYSNDRESQSLNTSGGLVVYF